MQPRFAFLFALVAFSLLLPGCLWGGSTTTTTFNYDALTTTTTSTLTTTTQGIQVTTQSIQDDRGLVEYEQYRYERSNAVEHEISVHAESNADESLAENEAASLEEDRAENFTIVTVQPPSAAEHTTFSALNASRVEKVSSAPALVHASDFEGPAGLKKVSVRSNSSRIPMFLSFVPKLSKAQSAHVAEIAAKHAAALENATDTQVVAAQKKLAPVLSSPLSFERKVKAVNDVLARVNSSQSAVQQFPELPEHIELTVSEDALDDYYDFTIEVDATLAEGSYYGFDSITEPLGSPLYKVNGAIRPFGRFTVIESDGAYKGRVQADVSKAKRDEKGQLLINTIKGSVSVSFAALLDQEKEIPVTINVKHVKPPVEELEEHDSPEDEAELTAVFITSSEDKAVLGKSVVAPIDSASNIVVKNGWAFPVPNGRIISVWGDSRGGGTRRHKGVDVYNKEGSPAVATRDGVVSKVVNTNSGTCGLQVNIKFDDGWYAIYCHNQKNLVRVGDRVKQGQVIALVGKTGNARTTPPHVHFEIRTPNGQPTNPLLRIPRSS